MNIYKNKLWIKRKKKLKKLNVKEERNKNGNCKNRDTLKRSSKKPIKNEIILCVKRIYIINCKQISL